MILVVGNIKGGVGKSVLSANIAAVLAKRGGDVLLIDGDEQGSASIFSQIRAEASPPAVFATVRLQGAAIRQQMRQLREKYREIVIDVGGRDTGSLRAALTVADQMLVPFQPRSVDIWAAGQIDALVSEARAANGALQASAILSIADVQGQDNKDALEALRMMQAISVLDCAVRRRKAFPNAFSAGLSVTEARPQDLKASDELLFVVNALYP